MECGGYLKSLEENSLLTLNSDVFRPLDKTSEISLRLDVSSDSKVSRVLGKEGTLDFISGALTTC